ncbi:MAG: hypothetical protein K6343_06510 [Caldisericaceae bacterium]
MNRSIIDELENLKELVEKAKKLPFSKYITIDKEELLGIILKIETMLPEEVKTASSVSKQREMILKDAYEEKNRIIKEAESEFKRIVEESNIVKEARNERERIIKEAEEEAKKIKEEALVFAKDLFAKIENVLSKAQNTLEEGKEAIENEINNQ